VFPRCQMVFCCMILAMSSALAQTKPVPPPPNPTEDGPAGAKSSTTPTLATQKDKFSYAVGLKMGEAFHKQEVTVDLAIFARGVKDGLAAGKTFLTDDEAQAVIKDVQSDLKKVHDQKMQEAGVTNKQEGEAFLEANREKEGVARLPSGLQYKILRYGTGPTPTASDTVVCNYRGRLINGKEFDSSDKRGQAASVPVGGVIKGWTEALQLMTVGSKWQLFIPSDLAYGERGVGTDIGPNAVLIYEVELLSIAGQSGGAAQATVPPQCNALDQAVQIDDAMPSGPGHCAGESDFWFTNTSGQAIDCAIIFHRNGGYDPASVLSFTLAPGEKTGGSGKISTCGADSGEMQYQCFPHTQGAATNSCTTRIQWKR
jgi:FKBP-type peptidyl-prolyl cis-trans isomerase FklB